MSMTKTLPGCGLCHRCFGKHLLHFKQHDINNHGVSPLGVPSTKLDSDEDIVYHITTIRFRRIVRII